jgi:hypothetical protein
MKRKGSKLPVFDFDGFEKSSQEVKRRLPDTGSTDYWLLTTDYFFEVTYESFG